MDNREVIGEVRSKDKNVVAQWHGITKDVVDKCGWVVTNPSKSRDKL